MKKILIVIVSISLILVLLSIYANKILKTASLVALDQLVVLCAQNDIKLDKPMFKDAAFNSLNSAIWRDITVNGEFKEDSGINLTRGKEFFINIGSVTISIRRLIPLEFTFEARNLRITAPRDDEYSIEDRTIKPPDIVEVEKVGLILQIDIFKPDWAASTAKSTLDSIKDFLNNGKTSMFIYTTGSNNFTVGMHRLRSRFFTRRHEGETYFEMDKADIKKLFDDMGRRTTNAEIEILSKNVTRAPRILRIGEYSEKKAVETHKKDNRISEDCYKHILWSYLLTKEYGGLLAKEIADAYESELYGNTEEDRSKDLINFAAGRRYARKEYEESELVDRILVDPGVMRS